MKRGRSTGKPTVAQRQRMDAIAEIGCIVAHSLGNDLGDRPTPAEVHHLTVGKHGAKRRGHDYTIGLNPWSQGGEPFGGMSAAPCEELFGPSYARRSRKFRQDVGTDDYLLDLRNPDPAAAATARPAADPRAAAPGPPLGRGGGEGVGAGQGSAGANPSADGDEAQG